MGKVCTCVRANGVRVCVGAYDARMCVCVCVFVGTGMSARNRLQCTQARALFSTAGFAQAHTQPHTHTHMRTYTQHTHTHMRTYTQHTHTHTHTYTYNAHTRARYTTSGVRGFLVSSAGAHGGGHKNPETAREVMKLLEVQTHACLFPIVFPHCLSASNEFSLRGIICLTRKLSVCVFAYGLFLLACAMRSLLAVVALLPRSITPLHAHRTYAQRCVTAAGILA